ncbi:hypothetical protein K1719_035051 [Acacia pycnantha]|nr:hypothetical protein K1719_035051 [Acacia pycnantha]
MAVTKDAIAHFDWSSFIIQELCEEIQEFKKDSQVQDNKNRSVGGCLYFLMLFCFQHFPLGDVIPSPHQSPMAFWTDKNVKRRVSVEKRSKKGLLLRSKPRRQLPRASVPPSTSFDPDTMLTHRSAIDIRTAAIQLATRNAGASAYIVEEARHEGEATYNRPTTSDESTMTMGMDMTREEEEHELRR